MDNLSTKPTMISLAPQERSRTYIYHSGYRYTLQDVVEFLPEKGWDRLKTADGKLHIVYLVIGKPENPVDWCIAKELDCNDWTV